MLKYIEEEQTSFDPRRSVESSCLCRLVKPWNSKMLEKIDVFEILSDGYTLTLAKYEGDEPSKSIFIQQDDSGRWNGWGYFQDPILSARSIQVSRTLPAISQNYIKPVIETETLIDTPTRKPVYKYAAAKIDRFSEPVIESLRKSSADLIASVKMLYHLNEVLDRVEGPFLRPSVHHLLTELFKSEELSDELGSAIRRDCSREDKVAFMTKWSRHFDSKTEELGKQELDAETKQEQEKDLKQREYEAGRQKEAGEIKQSEDGDMEQDDEIKQKQNKDFKDDKQQQDEKVKQEAEEDAKQEEDEDAKRREREEAEAAAAAYAAQDRYDSCSDSDEE